MCVSSGRARGGDRVAFDRGKKSCESRPDQYADHRNCEEHLGNARPQMARSSLEARAQGAECPDGKCGTAAGTRKGGVARTAQCRRKHGARFGSGGGQYGQLMGPDRSSGVLVDVNNPCSADAVRPANFTISWSTISIAVSKVGVTPLFGVSRSACCRVDGRLGASI